MVELLKIHLINGKLTSFSSEIFSKINLCFPSSNQSERYLKN